MLAKWSRALGFAKASLFLISLPCTMSLTASSVILPDRVLGISGTETTFAGMCLGVRLVLI